MGQAKNRGTFEQRKVLAKVKRDAATRQFAAWEAEVKQFRETFKLDIGIIGGAPPEARVVVCKFDALKSRLLGLDAPSVEDTTKTAAEKMKSALAGETKEG